MDWWVDDWDGDDDWDDDDGGCDEDDDDDDDDDDDCCDVFSFHNFSLLFTHRFRKIDTYTNIYNDA